MNLMVGVMTYERIGPAALDYMPCRYGSSKILFRGPRRRLDRPYIAFLGGTETYGKFLAEPYPALVEARLGRVCVNLGAVNAGADIYLNDPALLEVIAGAEAVVIQVMGAQNISNRYYAVHPRRNDRFLQASEVMKAVFRDVDFTEFHFTRHMLQALRELSADRFAIVETELKAAWIARMGQLIDAARGPVLMHWFAPRRMAEDGARDLADPAQSEPLFVDPAMLKVLGPKLAGLVTTVPSDAALRAGAEGMIFSQMEAPVARTQMGVMAHQEAADQLIAALAALLPKHRSTGTAR